MLQISTVVSGHIAWTASNHLGGNLILVEDQFDRVEKASGPGEVFYKLTFGPAPSDLYPVEL